MLSDWSSHKTSYYTPDFLLGDRYIEVKGFETALDRVKWSQFKGCLDVWRKPKISLLEAELGLTIETIKKVMGETRIVSFSHLFAKQTCLKGH